MTAGVAACCSNDGVALETGAVVDAVSAASGASARSFGTGRGFTAAGVLDSGLARADTAGVLASSSKSNSG